MGPERLEKGQAHTRLPIPRRTGTRTCRSPTPSPYDVPLSSSARVRNGCAPTDPQDSAPQIRHGRGGHHGLPVSNLALFPAPWGSLTAGGLRSPLPSSVVTHVEDAAAMEEQGAARSPGCSKPSRSCHLSHCGSNPLSCISPRRASGVLLLGLRKTTSWHSAT